MSLDSKMQRAEAVASRFVGYDEFKFGYVMLLPGRILAVNDGTLAIRIAYPHRFLGFKETRNGDGGKFTGWQRYYNEPNENGKLLRTSRAFAETVEEIIAKAHNEPRFLADRLAFNPLLLGALGHDWDHVKIFAGPTPLSPIPIIVDSPFDGLMSAVIVPVRQDNPPPHVAVDSL